MDLDQICEILWMVIPVNNNPTIVSNRTEKIYGFKYRIGTSTY